MYIIIYLFKDKECVKHEIGKVYKKNNKTFIGFLRFPATFRAFVRTFIFLDWIPADVEALLSSTLSRFSPEIGAFSTSLFFERLNGVGSFSESELLVRFKVERFL